mgnify:CR=1 FL=1
MQKLEMQQKYYEDKLKDEERVRAVYHDMKNHLLVLEGTQGTEAARQMAQELRAQIADYEDYIHTGNDFLDIIIRDKAEKAREKHIDFSAAIDIGGADFIEPLDISTLFGNGIDNAIEASVKLPEDKRLIRVYMDMKNTQLYISFTNFTAGKKLQKDGGLFHTTKGDGHGFGLVRIDAIVERLEGYISRNSEDGAYTTEILLPQV